VSEDLRVTKQRRSYARRRLRASLWRFIRENKATVGALSAITVAMAVFARLAEPSGFMQGLMIGVTATVLAAFFLLVFLISTGSIFTLAGVWGESFTNEEIDKAIKRGQVWGSVSNIEIGGFDIDHLVVAPSGVFAVETKMHTANLTNARKHADLDQARDSARKATSVLRSKHIELRREVRAVLVVWGKASADIPDGGREVDGVQLLAGSDLATWLSRQSTGRLAQDTAEEMLTKVKAFRNSQVLRDPVLA